MRKLVGGEVPVWVLVAVVVVLGLLFTPWAWGAWQDHQARACLNRVDVNLWGGGYDGRGCYVLRNGVQVYLP